MWRYLPPAVLMVCSALVLIAGATGDLQFWSESVDSLPSWRSVVDARPWSPVTEVWDAGVARFRHHPAGSADPAANAAAIAPAIAPAAAAPALPSNATTEPAPGRQSSAVQPPLAAASAALAAAPPAQEAASSPLQERLLHARQALASGRAAEARKMLETVHAEMLLRPVRESNAAQFNMSGTWLEHALLSLRNGDSPGALHDLDLAIASS